MQDNTRIRQFEPFFWMSIATLYVGRRLLAEVEWLDGLIGLSASGNGIPAGAYWRFLNGYDHTLNNNVPLIVGVCLFLVAWYLFHNLAFPKLQERVEDQSGWRFTGLAVGLLLATTFVYHYLKIYVRYQYNPAGNIIGLATYSLYSKRTVLADAIGLGIVLGTYEVLFQYYRYLSGRIAQESTRHFQLVSYLLLAGLVTKAIIFALTADSPLPLWQHRTSRNGLMLAGLGLQVVVLQHYVYAYIFPVLTASRTSEVILFRRISLYMLLLGTATMLLWGATTAFHYDNRDPLLLMAVVLVGSVSIAYGRQVLTKEKTVLQTQVSTGAAELASLRAQINPHFLFNALNSLYATALTEKGEKTADGIQKLGDMMRFMLHENNRDRIPLDKEIEYLRNYIAIQRMRIDETHPIDIRVTIQEPTRTIYIAPMLLTPFIENAFKYGISLRHASWIYITLTLDDTRLYFKVHNSRHLLASEPRPADHHDAEENRSGVGLDNVRKRLELIYPGRHQLDIQQSEQDYFVSLALVYQGEFKLEIPLGRQ